MSEIRIGIVSGINFEKGSITVTYEDRDNAVVTDIPYLYNKEYCMPELGDMVVVLEVSDGTEIAIGTFYNGENLPNSSENLYKKEFGNDASLTYDVKKEEIRIKASKIILETERGEQEF